VPLRADPPPGDPELTRGQHRASPAGWIATVRAAFGWPGSLRPSLQALLAFLAYSVVSVALYALPILSRFASAHAGIGGNDGQTFAWSLVWWPHAVIEGLNPLFTEFLWAPSGVSLAYVTTMPGPSLLMWPITELFGPLVSLNLLTVAAPPLAGWAAFLLCRRVTGSFWPSLAGGYLFGFSTYVVYQLTGHPNLSLVFPVPLAAYLVLRRVEGSLGPLAFVFGMAAVLAGLFSIFIELFATISLFGGLALLGAALLGPSDLRRPLLRTVGLLAAAYALAILVVSPYLLVAAREVPSEPIRNLEKASVDLLGFVVPRQNTVLGDRFLEITGDFTAPLIGDSAYLGIPLVAILVSFAVTGRRWRGTWLLLGFVLVTAIASLGPALKIRGRPVADLPWRLVEPIPLIHNALPDRFTMYVALTASVIVAVWLAVRPGSWIRWMAVVLAAVAILPDLSSLPYHRDILVPSFFRSDLHRRYIEPGDIVLVIPFGRGPGVSTDMLWQAETDMHFRLTTGNTGSIPPEHKGRTVRCLRQDQPGQLSDQDFLGWVRSHAVSSVVVEEGYVARWWPRLTSLGVEPRIVGGVWLFRLPAPGQPGSARVPVPPGGLPPARQPLGGGVRFAGYNLEGQAGC
jgi:hypothetical protein